MKNAALVLIAAALSLEVQAAALRVTFEGRPVSGASVCFFAAGAAENPLTRFFTASDVRCHAADGDVPLPSGRWNVFAEAGGRMSEGVELTADGRAPSELELVAAVPVDTTQWPLAEGEQLFGYLPRTASAFPLRRAAPIGVVMPLVVREKNIVGVGVPVELQTGRAAALAPPARTSRAAVVVPVRVKARPEGVAVPPVVTLVDAVGVEHRNVAAAREIESVSLAMFRDVAPGDGTVKVRGARWKSIDMPVGVTAPVAVVEKPLVARSASKLTVHWWTPVDLSTLRTAAVECKATEGRPDADEAFAATLLVCPDLNKPSAFRCKASQQVKLPPGELRGSVEFTDVPDGSHFVRFTYPGLPAITRPVEVSTKEESTADVQLRYASFFGTVTLGGKPVHAALFDTTTDPDTGRYVAFVDRLPSVEESHGIVLCDGSSSHMFVLEEAPKENSELDIEIPENRVTVEVVDAANAAPIPAANVNLGVLYPDDDRALYHGGSAGKTDEKGRLEIVRLLTNRRITICASHADYRAKCAETFQLKEPEKTVRISLERAAKLRGRIVNGKPVSGQLRWFSADGQTTEQIREFSESGEFTYRNRHPAGEIVSLISRNRPLYVFRQPPLAEDQVFEIAYPPARVRSFTVTLSPESREEVAWVGLQIGDVVVPANVVSYHSVWRGHQASLRPGETVTIPDILETGPISVILVPASLFHQFQSREAHLPLIPEVAAFPRIVLGPGNAVTFP